MSASTLSIAPHIACAADTGAAQDTLLQQAWTVLESVPDPEIPVVSIRELGILRDIRWAGDVPHTIEAIVTPTYSGCPAMGQIKQDIEIALEAAGITPFRVVTVLAPAWTTDWMTAEARAKLHAYGIAPPQGNRPHAPSAAQPLRFVPRRGGGADQPACPRCHATHTERLAQFGSTACKALYRCLDCREPFDYFKPY